MSVLGLLKADLERINLSCPLEHGVLKERKLKHPFQNIQPSKSFLFETKDISYVYSVFSGTVTDLQIIGSEYVFFISSDTLGASYCGDFDTSLLKIGKYYNRGEILTRMDKDKVLILHIWKGMMKLNEEIDFDCLN